MNTSKRLTIYNVLATICGAWFLLAGWVWVYLVNIILVFPFAILGFFLWRAGRAVEHKLLNQIAGWLLVAGLVVTLGALVLFLVSN